ncbi:MAG: RimK/LysX family protein [Acidimicrobiales bacterium]
MKRSEPSRPKTVIGWREWVGLPDCGVPRIKAKVDTGARTSALHAFSLEEFVEGDTLWVRFEVHPDQRSSEGAVIVTAPIVEHRRIRSSNGTVQNRPVIRTTLEAVNHRIPIDVTLTNRDEMGFRMLIGRAALRKRFLVDPTRSYCGGK